MRELILRRIEIIKTTFGAHRFGVPNKRNKLGFGQVWPINTDFSALSDEDLVKEFERIVQKAYAGWA